MSRIRRLVPPVRWNTITASVTQGQPNQTIALASFLQNAQQRTVSFSVVAGTLPTGLTLNGATGVITYDGASPVAAASVQFRATTGSFSVESALSTVSIGPSAAPTWLTAATLSSVATGQAFSFTLTATDAQSDPITFSFGQPPFGAITVQPQVGANRSIVWSGTAPNVLVDTSFNWTVDAADSSAAELDWLARSTAPGVVWAHDFRYDAELTQFLWSDNGATDNGIRPRLVADYPAGTAGRSLENMVLGATLAADFGVSATTAQFVDLTDWPSGDFYFVIGGNPNAGRSFQSGIAYNRFYCPANNGSTTGRFGNELRGLVFQTTGLWTTCTATRNAWLAGDNAGNHVADAWVRPFAALSSGNGLPSADINNAGVTARPWQPVRTNSAFGTWGYGFYGHPDYQSQTWTSAMATNAGSSAHGGAWDGSEFYLQMRVKVDPRFWNNHVPADQTSGIWGQKFFLLQTQQSSSQQISTFLPSKHKYYTPGNSNAPLTWFEHYTNNPASLGGALQPGGAWASTSLVTGAPRAATGQATPDGSSMFAYDADWVTLLYHVRPGHHLTADTFIEIYAARRDSAYQLVWSGNYSIGFTTTNDLPGYCALWLLAYLNIDINVSQNQVPVLSHFRRFSQIIFSKQMIAAPAVGA